MARGKTVQVRSSEASLYLDKAMQFLEQARAGLEAGRYDAASLDGIHAAISATDAVTSALAGLRSSDQTTNGRQIFLRKLRAPVRR